MRDTDSEHFYTNQEDVPRVDERSSELGFDVGLARDVHAEILRTKALLKEKNIEEAGMLDDLYSQFRKVTGREWMSESNWENVFTGTSELVEEKQAEVERSHEYSSERARFALKLDSEIKRLQDRVMRAGQGDANPVDVARLERMQDQFESIAGIFWEMDLSEAEIEDAANKETAQFEKDLSSAPISAELIENNDPESLAAATADLIDTEVAAAVEDPKTRVEATKLARSAKEKINEIINDDREGLIEWEQVEPVPVVARVIDKMKAFQKGEVYQSAYDAAYTSVRAEDFPIHSTAEVLHQQNNNAIQEFYREIALMLNESKWGAIPIQERHVLAQRLALLEAQQDFLQTFTPDAVVNATEEKDMKFGRGKKRRTERVASFGMVAGELTQSGDTTIGQPGAKRQLVTHDALEISAPKEPPVPKTDELPEDAVPIPVPTETWQPEGELPADESQQEEPIVQEPEAEAGMSPEEIEQYRILQQAIAEVLDDSETDVRAYRETGAAEQVREFTQLFITEKLKEQDDIVGTLREGFEKVIAEQLGSHLDEDVRKNVIEKYFSDFLDQLQFSLKVNRQQSESGFKNELKRFKETALSAGKFTAVIGLTQKGIEALTGPFGTGAKALIRGFYGAYQGLRGYEKQVQELYQEQEKSLKQLLAQLDESRLQQVQLSLQQSLATQYVYDHTRARRLQEQHELVDTMIEDYSEEPVMVGDEQFSQPSLLQELYSVTSDTIGKGEGEELDALVERRKVLLRASFECGAFDKLINLMVAHELEKISGSIELQDEVAERLAMQQVHLSVEQNMNALLGDIVAQDFESVADNNTGAFDRFFESKVLGTLPPESKMQALLNGFVSGAVSSLAYEAGTAGVVYATVKGGLGSFTRETKRLAQQDIVRTPQEVERNLVELRRNNASCAEVKEAILEARARIKLPDMNETDRGRIELAIEAAQRWMIMYAELDMAVADNNEEAESFTERLITAYESKTAKAEELNEQAFELDGIIGQVKAFAKLSKQEKKQVLKKAGANSFRGMVYGAVGAGVADFAVDTGEIAFDELRDLAEQDLMSASADAGSLADAADSFVDRLKMHGEARMWQSLDRAGLYGGVSSLYDLALGSEPEKEVSAAESTEAALVASEHMLRAELQEAGLFWETGTDIDDVVRDVSDYVRNLGYSEEHVAAFEKHITGGLEATVENYNSIMGKLVEIGLVTSDGSDIAVDREGVSDIVSSVVGTSAEHIASPEQKTQASSSSREQQTDIEKKEDTQASSTSRGQQTQAGAANREQTGNGKVDDTTQAGAASREQQTSGSGKDDERTQAGTVNREQKTQASSSSREQQTDIEKKEDTQASSTSRGQQTQAGAANREQTGNGKVDDTTQAGAATRFEDIIQTEKDSKTHDSLWRSARTIIQQHPEEFGYTGDTSDSQALRAFAERTTAELVADMGDVKDLVHNNDVAVITKDADGEWHLTLEEKSGEAAGYLSDTNVTESGVFDAPEEYALADGASVSEIKSDVGDVGLKVTLGDGKVVEVWDWDRDKNPNVIVDGKHQEMTEAELRAFLITHGVFNVDATAAAEIPSQEKTEPEYSSLEEKLAAEQLSMEERAVLQSVQSYDTEALNQAQRDAARQNIRTAVQANFDHYMQFADVRAAYNDIAQTDFDQEVSKKHLGFIGDASDSRVLAESLSGLARLHCGLGEHESDLLVRWVAQGDEHDLGRKEISAKGLLEKNHIALDKLQQLAESMRANAHAKPDELPASESNGWVPRILTVDNVDVLGLVRKQGDEYQVIHTHNMDVARLSAEEAQGLLTPAEQPVASQKVEDKPDAVAEAEDETLAPVAEEEGSVQHEQFAAQEKAYNDLRLVMENRYDMLKKIADGQLTPDAILADLPSALEDSGRSESAQLFASEADVQQAAKVLLATLMNEKQPAIPRPGVDFEIDFTNGLTPAEQDTLGKFALATRQYDQVLSESDPKARALLDYIDSQRIQS